MKQLSYPIILVFLAACSYLLLQPKSYADGPMHPMPIGPEIKDLDKKPDSFWKKRLSEQQFEVCREGGTERAGTGKYNAFKGKDGVFHCSSCGHKLFDAATKFDSGTGWPSFYSPASESAVRLKSDYSWGMSRTEVVCGRCGAHLGHVFDDGPKPTGKRYCINSVCLTHSSDWK